MGESVGSHQMLGLPLGKGADVVTKLDQLLRKTGESNAAFGQRLKTPRPAQTVHRWRKGRPPRDAQDALNIIAAIDDDPRTAGQLSWADLHPAPGAFDAAEAA